MRVFDSKETPNAGDNSTTLGIKVTGPVYTITWNANGGTISTASTQVKYGAATSAPATPTRDGYDFEGWSSTAGGSAATLPSSTTSNATWYAVWKLKSYAVSFNSNGGSAVDPQQVDHGGKAVEPAKPAWAGHRFDGWCSDAWLKTAYDCDAQVTSAKTLYAKWTPTYTVTFDKNAEGATGSMGSMDMAAGAPKSLTKNAFKRTGYAFAGWNAKSDGTGAPYEDGASVDLSADPGGEVTLYAQWSLVISCELPAAPTVTVDAAGKATADSKSFVSSTVEPLKVSAVKSSALEGASRVFADQATLDGARMVLAPPTGSGSAVKVPLSTTGGGVASDFTVPAKGELPIAFGLELPDNARLSYLADATADIASISYEIGPVSEERLSVTA